MRKVPGKMWLGEVPKISCKITILMEEMGKQRGKLVDCLKIINWVSFPWSLIELWGEERARSFCS